MGDSNKLATSDDEEDLEALRLAALQSLKKKNALNGMAQQRYPPHLNSEKHGRYNRSIKGMQNKRGRFFGPLQGRNGKNVPFNNRVRNTNLISIPTIPSEEEKVEEKKSDDSEITLTLPQDRYCGKTKKEEKTEEGTSKFTRYDKSDKSDTESEEEEAASSECDSPGKLKKSSSLEALMEELDAEIQGKTRVKDEKPAKEEKPKKKTKKKKRMSSEAISTSDSDAKASEQKEVKVEPEKIPEVSKPNENETVKKECEIKDSKVENKVREEPIENRRKFDDSYSPALKRPRSRSPINRRGFLSRQRHRNFQKFTNQPPPNISFIPPPTQYPAPMVPFPNQPFNPIYGPPNINIMSQPPPFFDRPLSPLAINTESLTTATLAPLSPRSAAFVLENKAIIERRKRSPRRSYSRSPSRSPRRSLTPRRSPRRSITPRRMSRSPRRLSRSPRRRSLSPRQRSLSPRRRNIGRSTDNSPKNKPPVRERLGVKSSKTEENKDKTKENEPSPKKEEKPLDPVLEARKRKFESNEIKMKEGIIRLKPKADKPKSTASSTPVLAPIATPVSAPKEKPSSSSAPKEKDHIEEEKKSTDEKKSIEVKESKELKEPKQMKEAKELKEPKEPKELKESKEVKDPDVFEELEKLLNEDALLEGDDIELDSKVDDIFSDEDSASDNEGRFKVKQQSGEKPPILPFTKLVNGAKKDIKSEALPDLRDKRRDRRGSRFDKKKPRGRSPIDKKDVKENLKEDEDKKSTLKKVESQEKPLVKNRITLKSERYAPTMEKRFERKIEIKIKNPSKYERGGKLKFSKDTAEKTPEKVKRKVELGRKEDEEEDEVEPEIVVENDSGDEENSVVSEGDLRAQLSKKRAEKLNRIPIEGVSSRLLQSALQGAVFKEKKKKSKEQDITSSDGKLPVYLRLGIANNSDIFTDTKVKRKSRKRKNREVLEQV